MNERDLTPEESLLIISRTIEETKKGIQNNGHIIIFWGMLTFIVFLSQYVLVFLELHKVFDIIWTCILFPLGAIYTFIYFRLKTKKNNTPKTFFGRLIGTMGWVVGINLMILGFFFGDELGKAIAPVFLILLALFMLITGISVKFKPFIVGGILMNVTGFATFMVSTDYHGLSMMVGSLVGLIIPGILLNKAKKTAYV